MKRRALTALGLATVAGAGYVAAVLRAIARLGEEVE